MTSTLTFYQTEITPERNCVVDEINSYLTNGYTVSNFQYIKIDLDVNIKLNLPQTNVPKFNYNYCRVRNSDLTKDYFYFIVGSPKWISSNTVSLQLSLDTINTFREDLKWTSRTKIKRQHKDRFSKVVSTSGNYKIYKRRVDSFEEGITPTKFLSSYKRLEQDLDLDWYLIYKNKENLTANSTVPIDCFCCASQPLTVKLTADTNGVDFSTFNAYDAVYIFAKDNVDFTWNGNEIGKAKENKGLVFLKTNESNNAYLLKEDSFTAFSNLSDKQLTDVQATLKCYKTSNYDPIDASTNYTLTIGRLETQIYSEFSLGTNTGSLLSIDSLDRTDTRLIKVIKMPYCPFTPDVTNNQLKIPAGWTYSGGYLLLENLNNEFLSYVTENDSLPEMTVKVLQGTIAKGKQNDPYYESKLYNSNFYTLKYMYDNFDKEFLLERYSTNLDNPGVGIKFKQSNNISSNSLFDLTATNGSYDEVDLYTQYLNVNRQNEVALFNSDYLNYIRTGYNYDKKAKTQSTVSNIAGIALGAAATVASFLVPGAGVVGAAAAISFTTNTLSSVANAVSTAVSNERAIAEKLETTRKNPASVSNTEDLNLLSYYNGNRLLRVTEQPTKQVKDAVYNLFRLTGYACDDTNVPVTNSRTYYNFLKCEPDFEESQWTYGKAFLDDIKARYEVGVTYFHRVDDDYDWLQEKENFETWMINS